MEPVKTVVCKREETHSRSTKDSATLLIAGGRHENCVQSLKDCSEEIQVPHPQARRGGIHRDDEVLLRAHLVSGSPHLLSGCLRVEQRRCLGPSELPEGTGTRDTGAMWEPFPLELPLKAGGTPRKAAGSASCLRWGERLPSVRAPTPAKSAIGCASSSEPKNPFASTTASNFLLLL